MNRPARSFFVALVALVLAAGAAVAQQDMGNASGGTFTVGVVESFGSNSVTIRKDNGASATFLLEEATVGKQYLANGARARIDYVTNAQNQGIAQEIEIHGPSVVAEAAPAAAAESYQVASAEPVAPAPSAAAPAQTTAEALPATASRLPLFALLGLLALGGGVALRLAR